MVRTLCVTLGATAGPADAVAAAIAPRKILIVEDNRINRIVLREMLQTLGHRVVIAENGRQAVQLAGQHAFDLILMDIQLPEVSGIEVTKWLKEDEELRSIPVVAVTAFAMKGDEQKIREGGCEAYISKPISVASFMATINGFFEVQS